MPDPGPVGKAEAVGKIVRDHRGQSGQAQHHKENKDTEKQKRTILIRERRNSDRISGFGIIRVETMCYSKEDAPFMSKITANQSEIGNNSRM